MKRQFALGLTALSLMVCAQPSFAGLHKGNLKARTNSAHNNNGLGLALGNFYTDCTEGGPASASSQNVIDPRTNHNIQVARISATGFNNFASTAVENLGSRTLMLAPINFLLVNGPINWFGVAVTYIPQGSTCPVVLGFTVPGSDLVGDGFLVPQPDGSYNVPFADSAHNVVGIPRGAQLVNVEFDEVIFEQSCTTYTNDVSHVRINGRFIPIDLTSPAAFCDGNCGGGS